MPAFIYNVEHEEKKCHSYRFMQLSTKRIIPWMGTKIVQKH